MQRHPHCPCWARCWEEPRAWRGPAVPELSPGLAHTALGGFPGAQCPLCGQQTLAERPTRESTSLQTALPTRQSVRCRGPLCCAAGWSPLSPALSASALFSLCHRACPRPVTPAPPPSLTHPSYDQWSKQPCLRSETSRLQGLGHAFCPSVPRFPHLQQRDINNIYLTGTARELNRVIYTRA